MATPNAAVVAKPLHYVCAVVAALLTWACDNQEPAFQEDRTLRSLNSENAIAGGPLVLPPEGSAGQGGASGGGDGADGIGSGDDAGASEGGDDLFGGGDTGDGSTEAGGADGAVDSGSGGADAGSDDSTGGGGTGTGWGDPGNEGGIGTSFRSVDVVQQGPGKVDILWIIDTSGSMSEEQQYLASNFNSLINQLASSGHNFQTAVTTTDVCHNTLPSNLEERVCPLDYGGSSATRLRGAFVGDAGRKVLRQGDSDLVSRFNAYVRRGTNGSGFEHGLEAARLAVQKVLTGDNENLIRGDAFLAVIVVSDEEDDGIGLSQRDAYHGHNFWNEGLTRFRFTEDDMISYLRTVKGEGNFSISAIAPTRKANGGLCSAPHTQPLEEGLQYIKAAQKSGGIIQSICETNWSSALGSIGLDLSAQITQVVLPSTPDVPTINVYVDGQQTTHWTYNAGNNAVKFNSEHVPAEGALIQITYYDAQ